MSLTTRVHDAEKLDATSHDDAALGRNMEHLVRVNRWLGGTRVILRYLGRLIQPGETATVLDVGTGSADIPLRIVQWSAGSGRRINVLAVDRQLQIARLAQSRCTRTSGIAVAVASGHELPMATGSVDVAIMSLTLHHCDDDLAVACLAELARVSRSAVLVNDLERHRVNYLGARFLSRTVWRNDPYARHDGPLSVRRSFTPAELETLARAAGLLDVGVHRHFPYRLAMLGRPCSPTS